jgi:excisionase family DNA binding protein
MEGLFALPEAARVLGNISHWTLRKHVSEGRIRVVRIGRRIFLDAEELQRIRRDGLPSLRIKARNATRGQGRLCPGDHSSRSVADRLVAPQGRDEVR